MPDQLTVCYVLAYRNPAYVRTVSLLSALKSQNHEVVEVINRRTGLLRYLEVPVRLAVARIRHRPNVYLLGFRGHEIFWPVRALTLGRPLIFDSLVSPTESLVAENKLGRGGQLAGRLLRPLERLMLRSSSAVLTDTEEHRSVLANRFSLPAEKIYAVPIGAFDSDHAVRAPGSKFRVLFYATMIPLHGMDVVRRAIEELEAEGPEWRIIGGSPDAVPATVDHASWIELSEIVETEIPTASLGLGGPFGATEQALRVVTGKTVQFMASGLPVLVANSEAHRSAGFVDRRNCVMSEAGNSQSLIDSIRWAMAHPENLEEIGRRGRALYLQNFGVDAIAEALEEAMPTQ